MIESERTHIILDGNNQKVMSMFCNLKRCCKFDITFCNILIDFSELQTV